jgi:hypothetical protein
MNTRHYWLIGLASLGLTLAIPVHAAPEFMNGGFIVAERDQANDARMNRREGRREARRDERPAPGRDAERDEPRGYGYGYERRQKQRSDANEDTRPRDRR